MTMTQLLSAEDIYGGYGDRRIVHGVSFSVVDGERVLMVGPNGCGKTTLLKMLVGALAPSVGRVVLQGRDVTATPTHLRMPLGLGYLMQTRNVFPSLTVEENLHLSFWHGNGGFEIQRNRLIEVFTVLKGKLHRRAGLLSGGERQSLAVCMVMMRPVKLLLLDEPTAGLSPKAAESILKTIHQAQEAFGFTSIIVEHNLRLVGPWVSRVLVMRQGRIETEESDTKLLIDDRWLQRWYFE